MLREWNRKPLVVRKLTMIWGFLALHYLLYGTILTMFTKEWDSIAFGVCFCVSAAFFSWAHFRSINPAWAVGIFISLSATFFSIYLLLKATESLISFFKTGYPTFFFLQPKMEGPHVDFDMGFDGNIPFEFICLSGLASNFILILAEFWLAVSRPARVAYGAET